MPTRGRGSRYKIPGPGGSEGGPGSDNFPYVYVFLCSFIICRVYKLILSAQAKITLQLRVSLSDLVQIFLTGPPLLRCQKIFFHRAPNPLSAPRSHRNSVGTTHSERSERSDRKSFPDVSATACWIQISGISCSFLSEDWNRSCHQKLF